MIVECEGIVNRFFDGVIGVIYGVVYVCDCVIGCIGNFCMCSGIFEDVEFWIIEFVIEKRYWIVIICILF